MGKIINLKTVSEEKVFLTLELTQNEILKLKGSLDKMHLFSEENFDITTRLVQRGKRDSTKYILIPKEFRKIVVPSNNIKCDVIKTKNKNLLIFAVENSLNIT